MNYSIYKMPMTIRPHIFYSFIIHVVVLGYVLALPIYIGSEFSISFGSYSVDLVSEESPPERSSGAYRPPKAIVQSFEKHAFQAKGGAESVPETESEEEKSDETAVIPSGISMLDEKPKEETLLTKKDIEVQEQETEKEVTEVKASESVAKAEEKPEPARPEPVREEPPQESKPQPAVVKKEVPPAQEPKAVHVADAKPSKVDKSDEQLQEHFPVKPAEKAPEISPLTMKEETLLPKKQPPEPTKEESLPLKEVEKPMTSSPVSEKKEETTDKKETGEGEGKDKEGEVKKDTSKSLTEAKKPRSNGSKSKNKGLKKSIAGDKKGKDKGLKAASLSPGQLPDQGAVSSGTREGAGTRMSGGSSGQGDMSGVADGQVQTDETNGSGTKIARQSTEKKAAMGIVIPLLTDIKVEVFLHGTDSRVLSSQLYRRMHPSDEEDRRSENQEVRLIREPDNEGKATFYVAKAEKGIYTFVMTNKSETPQKANLMIRLLEGKKEARNRKIEPVDLAPHSKVKIKFLLPEAVFWDDDTYFTGMAESSESISKFNDISGIIWKEEKE